MDGKPTKIAFFESAMYHTVSSQDLYSFPFPVIFLSDFQHCILAHIFFVK